MTTYFGYILRCRMRRRILDEEDCPHAENSVKTIETHRMQLMERIDTHDIAGLVCYAIRVRLVEARPIAREQRSRGARSFSCPSQGFPDCFFDGLGLK